MISICKKTLATIFLIGFILSPALAGKNDTIDTWGSQPEKVAKKVWFGPMPSQLKKLASSGMPKRIGLISFYLFDTGSHDYIPMADVIRYESWGIVDLGANQLASAFAVSGVPAMQKEFAAHGLELLTPSEFLQTPKQVTAYVNFELPEGGFQKFTKRMQGFFDRNPHATGAARGFKMIPTHFWMSPDILRSLDTLRLDLGLDAMVVLTNNTNSNKNTTSLSSVALQFFGPNPDPKPENKLAAKYWTPMLAYATGTFGKGFKGVKFHNIDKENDPSQIDGYDGLVGALTAKTLDEIQRRIDKGK